MQELEGAAISSWRKGYPGDGGERDREEGSQALGEAKKTLQAASNGPPAASTQRLAALLCGSNHGVTKARQTLHFNW